MQKRRITDFELQSIPICIYRRPNDDYRGELQENPLIYTRPLFAEENLAFIYGMDNSDREIEYFRYNKSELSGKSVDRITELVREVKITNPKFARVHEYNRNCIQKDFEENVRFSSQANQNAVTSIKMKKTAAKDCAEMLEGIKKVDSVIIRKFKKLASTANPKRIRGLSFRARGMWEKKVGGTRINEDEGDITMEKNFLGNPAKSQEESLLTKIKNRNGSHAPQPPKSKGYYSEKKVQVKNVQALIEQKNIDILGESIEILQ